MSYAIKSCASACLEPLQALRVELARPSLGQRRQRPTGTAWGDATCSLWPTAVPVAVAAGLALAAAANLKLET
jgi:hypothetical protein